MYIEGLLSTMKSCIVNTVHDSIVIDVHPDEERLVIEAIHKTNMELSDLIKVRWGIEFNVPLLLEAKIGPNWLDTKDIS
jgi:DNA polymerase I-like protein with 3'-5' exonuclease and polymerase domains